MLTTAAESPDNHDSLLYAPLIVRGVVESYTRGSVPFHEWGGEELSAEIRDRPFPIRIARVRILEVMKGGYRGQSIEIGVIRTAGDMVELIEGENYILCLWYRDELRGGSYYLSSARSVFLYSGGGWIHCSDGTIFEPDAIRSLLKTTTIPYLAAHADLVAVGDIRAIEMTTLTGPNGERAKVRECTMTVSSVLKGEVVGRTVTFKMIIKGQYSPPWRTRVPWAMNVGETWYVFLKKGEVGYYPVGGANGLLKVEGRHLIYDNAVPFPYLKVQADSLVEEAVQ